MIGERKVLIFCCFNMEMHVCFYEQGKSGEGRTVFELEEEREQIWDSVGRLRI